MTREEAKKLLPVITAYAEGKEIEFKDKKGIMWVKSSFLSFDVENNVYRIAPEKKYRPFTMEEFLPHNDRWIMHKETSVLFWPQCVNHAGICFYNGMCSFGNLFKNYTFENGEPCGVLDETL